MKEKKTLNSSGKNLNDNEMESVSGGVKVGDPIWGQCEKCGARIQVGKEGVNLAMPKICEKCMMSSIKYDKSAYIEDL